MYEVIPYADTFRTYDVPAIMSIPMTMQKLSDIINLGLSGKCIINCEDEVYVAAAGGFSMGVMRHPYVGDFVNGKADMSFPAFHRSLKSKMHEVLRAVHWHRIAPAFGIGCTENKVSADVLEDSWLIQNVLDELEEWWLDVPTVRDFIKDGVLLKSAPAQIARNTPFALVSADEKGRVPFIVAAKNPNGAISVATLGRTEKRTYGIPRCDVSLDAEKDTLIGVFSSSAVALGIFIATLGGGSFTKYNKFLIGDILSVTPSEIGLLAAVLVCVLIFWVLFSNKLSLIAVHPQLASSRGIPVGLSQTLFTTAIAVVVTLSISSVGLLILNSLLVLPAAAARNISRNIREYTLFSLVFALTAGLGGLTVSYYLGSSTGAAISLILALIFAVTFACRKVRG